MEFKTLVLDKKCRLVLYPSFYSFKKSNLIYEKLIEQVEWQQGQIRIFGKKLKEPRLSAFFADEGVEYKYSGRLNAGLAWNRLLSNIKKDVEKKSGFDFNSLLLNYYRDQNDSMGWHRDNEKQLKENPVVASLSFGQERDFYIRRYADKSKTLKIKLTSGSLLLMLGATQHEWEHCVKKQTGQLSGRLNLTFRKVFKN